MHQGAYAGLLVYCHAWLHTEIAYTRAVSIKLIVLSMQGGEASQEEQEAQQQAAEDKRRAMLSAFLTAEARERCEYIIGYVPYCQTADTIYWRCVCVCVLNHCIKRNCVLHKTKCVRFHALQYQESHW